MLNKELILDCLIDGNEYGECETQIIQYFKVIGIRIDIAEIKNLLNEMVKDGLICIEKKWKNEKNEFPYIITTKGKNVWDKLHNK